jgi:hypothetical protein
VFEQGDLFAADLSRATVITLFLLPSINLKLRPKLLSLRPGTRVVSNTFTMDQWQSDEATRAEPETGCSLYCVAYLWIVPAAVGGRWKHPAGELVFLQRFQTVTGILGGAPLIGRLRGEDIVFSADGIEYRGRLVSGDSRGNTTRNMPGDALEGTFSSGAGTGRWRAERVK